MTSALQPEALADQDYLGYQYVTLRLVPSIEREEFLNVGVVVYAQAVDFLDAATHLDGPRVCAFAPDLDFSEVTDALAGLCAAVRGAACPGRPQLTSLGQRFGWIAAPRSTILQPGPIHGGVTTDPRATLVHLMERLVLPTAR